MLEAFVAFALHFKVGSCNPVLPSLSKPSNKMGLCSTCVGLVSAVLDTAALMWCFSIVNYTTTHT